MFKLQFAASIGKLMLNNGAPKTVSASQFRCYAAPKKSNLPPDQEDAFVDVENAEQLCHYAYVNYRTDVEGPGPKIEADSEYPAWLFQLESDIAKELEDLDPERDGWKYWEKWEERRQQQMLRHDQLKYKYFWLQNSPSIEIFLRHTKYKYKTHKFLTIPNTTPVYMKHTRRRRLKERHWTSLEEPEEMLENNG